MKRRFKSFPLIIGWAILLLYVSSCHSPQAELSTLKLETLNGPTFEFAQLQNNKATALFFFASECPLSQNYTLTIKKIREEFPHKEIEFLGVFPGEFETDSLMNWFVNKYPVEYPMLLDPHKTLTDQVKATITPEVFLIDSAGHVLYNGAIDNWAYELGSKREVITEHYLRDALAAVIEGREIKFKKTKAVGCIIE